MSLNLGKTTGYVTNKPDVQAKIHFSNKLNEGQSPKQVVYVIKDVNIVHRGVR